MSVGVISESPMSKTMSECNVANIGMNNAGYTFVRKNTFLEVIAPENKRGRMPERAMSEPCWSRETTPTRKGGAGSIEDRSTDTGSTNKGSPTATPTMMTRSLNQQPMGLWQQQSPFNNFWQQPAQPAGFLGMEGENMEWHQPNGPNYDNMMYDGNNQWNGHMYHGGYNNDEWMMDGANYGWDGYDENGEYGRDRRMHHDKRMGMHRDKRLGNKGRGIQRGDSRSKVFVGGLCSRTTDESLRAAFEHFGNVVHASVLVDAQSRRSRGFGYVTCVGEVPSEVSDRDHEVDGRMCGARLYKYN